MPARPTRSSRSSWARRSSRARISSRQRRARSKTLTSETAAPPTRRARAAAPARRDRDGAFDFEPHRCFACGELNEHGLHLAIHTDPSGAWTETTLEQQFQGWEAVAHGGIVCTLLDEVMAWGGIGRGPGGGTARPKGTFPPPVPPRAA